MGETRPCLPVPPSVREVTYTEVTYCIERRADGLWHEHVALYEGDVLVRDHCTLDDH